MSQSQGSRDRRAANRQTNTPAREQANPISPESQDRTNTPLRQDTQVLNASASVQVPPTSSGQGDAIPASIQNLI